MEKIVRDTNVDLMNHVLEKVKESGNYERAEKIIDYFLIESRNVLELSNYEFDFLAVAVFGSNEGIYIDCIIRGLFQEDNQDRSKWISCGIFKTLDTSLEAMQIMGELAGSLTYFEREYVNGEIDRYTPVNELLYQKYRRIAYEDRQAGGSFDVKTYKTNVVCPKCGGMLSTSDLYGYPFVCPNCNENIYSMEAELPHAGSVVMEVPIKQSSKSKFLSCAIHDVYKKNYCSERSFKKTALSIGWDRMPTAEEIRNVAIAIEVYMENWKIV